MILFSCFAGFLLLISKANSLHDNEESEANHLNDAIVEEVQTSRTLESFITKKSNVENDGSHKEEHCSSISKRFAINSSIQVQL